MSGIAPGATRTLIHRSACESKDAEAGVLPRIRYERIGEPAAIGQAAVWLCSDTSDDYLTTILFVDAGMSHLDFREGG